MLKALFNCVPFFWIKDKHLAQKLKCSWVCLREDSFEALLVANEQLRDVLAGKFVPNERHVFGAWCAQNADSSLDLVKIVVSGEQRSPAEQLSKYAADGPNIQGISVVACIQNDFWSSVPPCYYILGES